MFTTCSARNVQQRPGRCVDRLDTVKEGGSVRDRLRRHHGVHGQVYEAQSYDQHPERCCSAAARALAPLWGRPLLY